LLPRDGDNFVGCIAKDERNVVRVMRRGLAILLGAMIGVLVGGLGTFLAVLVYFVANGSGGPNGLGIAVVLAAFAGALGSIAGGAVGALIAATRVRR
jgi:hypothetical protein